MNVTINKPPVPEVEVTITMPYSEAEYLRTLLGALSSVTPPTNRPAVVAAKLYNALKAAGIDFRAVCVFEYGTPSFNKSEDGLCL